ncbi:MAG: nucleotide-binding protein [Oscillospiraceae bacterium]|nr:nucleotide-binding protein [Oscillospiraceae bacterium]
MMNFNVYVDSNSARVNNDVTKAIEKMNAHQSEFILIDKRDTINNQRICECIQSSVNSQGEISYPHARKQLLAFDISAKYIIVSDKPFDDNWFAHSNENYWFSSVSDWEENYAPPHMEKYIQYEIIQFFAYRAADMTDKQIRQFGHNSGSVNCIFDFCTHKSDIKISMQSGAICPKCIIELERFGVSDNQFKAINILLKVMTGKATFDKVFIVHGHEGKDEVARFIESLGLTAIILSEQSSGRTIIEKFEQYADKADFAVILYTPDDLGCVKTSPDKLTPRARQNVVFEHGYFTAKLGKDNIRVLLRNGTDKTKLEREGDSDGIVYIPFDEHSGWKEEIKTALRLSGYRVSRELCTTHNA